MRTSVKGAAFIGLAVILVAGGYWLGSGGWPTMVKLRSTPPGETAPSTTVGSDAATMQEPSPPRRVLYWKDPAGAARYSAGPNKTANGRDYIPVHEDEEPLLPGETRPEQPNAPVRGDSKKILYYRNPMGLPDTSPVPKKDWMGMDYIPVYEGEVEGGSVVRVSAAKIQRTGVRTERAAMRRLVRPVRAPGVAKPDERTLLTVALRADSFIEKLYVNETGRHVTKGEPLFRVYSPEMVKVQVDYLVSTDSARSRDEDGALQRLANLQIPKAVVGELRRARKPVISFDWPAPVSGVVMRKPVIEGMMMKAGDEVMRLADLSSIWVVAEVPEQDIDRIRIGSGAKVTFRAFPGEVFEGRVSFVLHELEMATRTAKVRIELANPDHRIKHEMFADVEVDAGDGEADRLAVPLSALIDSGNRQVVLVDLGEGRFEPRPVKIGRRGDDHVEIVEGIEVGDSVVVAANFLIDAESNLKAALSAFTADSPKEGAPPAGTSAVDHRP